MMERAGMSEMDIYHRTHGIFLYFKLPFDSEPPEEWRRRLSGCAWVKLHLMPSVREG